MNSIIKEISTCPPADRLRMILTTLGSRCDFVGIDQLLSVGFDSIRILEQLQIAVPSVPLSPSVSTPKGPMASNDQYVSSVDDDVVDEVSDCLCPECTELRSRYGVPVVSTLSSPPTPTDDIRKFLNQQLGSMPSPQELPRSMMDAVNWTDLLDQTPSAGPMTFQQNTTPFSISDQNSPSSTYKS